MPLIPRSSSSWKKILPVKAGQKKEVCIYYPLQVCFGTEWLQDIIPSTQKHWRPLVSLSLSASAGDRSTLSSWKDNSIGPCNDETNDLWQNGYLQAGSMQGGEFPGFESGKEISFHNFPKLWKTSSRCLLFQGVFYGITLYSTRKFGQSTVLVMGFLLY